MPDKQVKLKLMPEFGIIYHYTKSNGVNGIIKNNCFWATKSNFLNDPKEFSYIENIVLPVCNEYIKNDTYKMMFIEDVMEESVLLDGGENTDYFVLSFSNCRDSITMWEQFANRTGYNIAFSSDDIVKRIGEENKIEYHGFVVYKT